MANPKIPDSEYIQAAKLLKPNTHKMVVHCLEFHHENMSVWTVITFRCDCTCQHTDTHVCCGVAGWRNPKDAAQNMQHYKALHPEFSFRISRYPMPQEAADAIIANSVWEKREATRMTDGTYEPLPWADEPWFKDSHERMKHYAHVSQDRDGMIAFTENNDKGSRDIQKRMAPGRYLDGYYGDTLHRLQNFKTGAINVHGEEVTESPLQHYANMFTRKYGDTCTLQFATTSEEMVEVYKQGPDSCMTFRNDDFSGHIHPVSIYAAGDLQLAYLRQNDGDITARALVWPAKKQIGRLYGDSGTLLYKLKELGYEDPGGSYNCIKGARMLKVENEDGTGFIMPFLDADSGYYHEANGYWIIGSNPTNSRYTNRAGNQNGLDYESDPDDEYICDHCGDGTNDPMGVYVLGRRNQPSEELWCDSCASHHSFICAATHDRYSDSVPIIELANGRTIAQINADNYFECSVDGGWYHIDDSAGTYEGDDDTQVSTDASNNLVWHEETSSWYRLDHLPEQEELELEVPEVSEAPEVSLVSQVAA